MCGRIAQTETPEELADLLGVSRGLEEVSHLGPSFNVPPSKILPGLTLDLDGGAKWAAFEWGMLPSWGNFRRPVINARCETAHEKPMFRHAFRSRRCVIPVSAYYEWLTGSGGKQPYCIRPADGSPMLLAALYTGGQCVILTRAARPDIAHIHDRMPVAVSRLEVWLHELKAAVAAFAEADRMELEFFPVTRRMGNPRINGPQCLDPAGG